jgi:23S rRNA (guanosine2251-2'-O)-methyltransferase
MSHLVLKNPHSILAVFERRPSDVLRIQLSTKVSGRSQPKTPSQPQTDDPWLSIAALGKAHKIPLGSAGSHGHSPSDSRKGSGKKSSKSPSDESLRMGGSEVTVKERTPLSIQEIFRDAKEKNNGHGLWLALDQIQDPQNLGAIFRAAGFFGVQGIIITQDRSAPLTATAYDVAAGGLEYVPFCVVTNMKNALEHAKEAGVWILGTSEHAHDDISSIPRDRPWLLVLGNEEKGIRRLTEESCDMLCRISGLGGVSSTAAEGRVTSLNVSVATGILISRLI